MDSGPGSGLAVLTTMDSGPGSSLAVLTTMDSSPGSIYPLQCLPQWTLVQVVSIPCSAYHNGLWSR